MGGGALTRTVDPAGDPRGISTPALALCGVTAGYDERPVLEGLDLDVRAGEFLVLLGPNGSGKSTILRTMAGFVSPSCGSVRFFGEDVTAALARDRDVAVMYQGHGVFSQMTVAGNIEHYLKFAGLRDAAVLRRREELLELVRLGGREGREVSRLSAGEQQRVNLARVLAMGRRVLLLHEPLSCVDPDLRGELIESLRQVQQGERLTIVMTTRDPREAWSTADRVAVVRDGQVQDLGEPRRVYSEPRTACVARLTGPANIVAGFVESADHSRRSVTVSSSLGPLTCRGQLLREGEPVEVLIRPENVHLETGPTGAGLPGRVVGTRFFGSHWCHTVHARGQRLVALSFGSSCPVPEPGDDVRVLIDDRGGFAMPASGRLEAS